MEPIAVTPGDFLPGPSNQPGLARLPGGPDGEIVAAVGRVTHQMVDQVIHQLPSGDHEVAGFIDRTVGMESSLGLFHGIAFGRGSGAFAG